MVELSRPYDTLLEGSNTWCPHQSSLKFHRIDIALIEVNVGVFDGEVGQEEEVEDGVDQYHGQRLGLL